MLLMNSVMSPTAIYVDDGAIATHSDSLATNIAMLQIARSTAERWLNERGLSTELSKDGLIHFSRRRDQNANLGLLRIRSGADRRQRRFGSSNFGWIRLRALRILVRRGSGSRSADPIDLLCIHECRARR
jgi:hypothetical protein